MRKACLRELDGADRVYVPTQVLFEVYRKIVSSRSEDQGLSAVAALSQYEVLDMSREVALLAADLSLQKGLPMADSIVLAHAQQVSAKLITLDNDFSGLPGARVIR